MIDTLVRWPVTNDGYPFRCSNDECSRDAKFGYGFAGSTNFTPYFRAEAYCSFACWVKDQLKRG